MRLLDRYLLRELLFPLGCCLGGFLLLWITSDLITSLSELRDNRLRALDVVWYYVLRTPQFVVLILPIGLLLALLYALNNHARHQEITAIRAAGVSLWRLSAPYFAVGIVGGLVLLTLNEWAVPASAEAAEAMKQRRAPGPAGRSSRDLVRNLCFNNTRDGRSWRIGLYNVQTGEMFKPIVSWTTRDSSKPWQLQAERARRVDGVWTFYDAREFREHPQPNMPPFPSLETNVLVLPELSETPEEIESEIKVASVLSLFSLNKGDLSIAEIRNYLRLHPRLLRTDAARLHTKLHEHLAKPFTCLVVVLIAIPFGAASGRRNVFMGVAGSVAICVAFYFLQQFCLTLGSGGTMQPWVAGWLPNVAFGAVGLWMTSRVR
jgi:lipopolysaccharide export system permease protein